MSFPNYFDKLGKHRQVVVETIESVRRVREKDPRIVSFTIEKKLNKKALNYLSKVLFQEHRIQIEIIEKGE